jgi:ribosomal protein S18
MRLKEQIEKRFQGVKVLGNEVKDVKVDYQDGDYLITLRFAASKIAKKRITSNFIQRHQENLMAHIERQTMIVAEDVLVQKARGLKIAQNGSDG